MIPRFRRFVPEGVCDIDQTTSDRWSSSFVLSRVTHSVTDMTPAGHAECMSFFPFSESMKGGA